MLYFLKGSTLLYAGQEFLNQHLPSLFEKDVFQRDEAHNQSGYLARLAEIKKSCLSCQDYFWATADDEKDLAVLTRDDGKVRKLGIFSLSDKHNIINVNLENRNYVNHITGETISVCDGKLETTGEPIIITVSS